uniref:Carboxypeptidase n=1 Tax=Psorophora albipes TaxID=869069 RepID=T1DI41_9DIPT
MKFNLVVLALFACYSVSEAFWNPYRRFFKRSAAPTRAGESGEPLFLTKLLQDGKIEEARNRAKVNHPLLTGAESYSGLVTVDLKTNSNLFFWHVAAKSNRQQAPVVVYLQGGPGSSSLLGLFEENGPWKVHRNMSVTHREYSWHVNHHLVYVDNPVGTGFSFTDSEEGYSTNEEHVGENLYRFLRQFYVMFPNLLANPLYVVGESYGGKFAVALSHTIHNSPDAKLNLQGLAIGDAFVDPRSQLHHGDFLYQIGLIDHKAKEKFDEDEAAAVECVERNDFQCALRLVDELLEGVDGQESYFKKVTGFSSYYNYVTGDEDDTGDNALMKFLSTPDVRKAMHVGDLPFQNSDGHGKVAEKLSEDLLDTVAPWVSEQLSERPVLFYNGQLDVLCAYPQTVDFLLSLPFDGSEEYKDAPREIHRVDGDIVGYRKKAGNLREVLIRNAGHMAPRDQPKATFDIISSFTHRKSF